MPSISPQTPEAKSIKSLLDYRDNYITDFKWQARFGDIVRVKGIPVTDRLLISDPKALHHIYNSGYNIQKHNFRSKTTRLLTGPGLAWANDETHRRQRRLSSKWKENTGSNGLTVVNTPRYFSRFFLDVISEVAFDYQFSATNDENDPLSMALSSVAPQISLPSKAAMFISGVLELMPTVLAGHQDAVGVAKGLVDEKTEALVAGKNKRDIMSLLVKANASENPRMNLAENEMLAQMQVFPTHNETTAITMSWTLFELTQHPDVQTKLRAEIIETERVLHARGDTEYMYIDFEAMPYTIAIMKVSILSSILEYCTISTVGSGDGDGGS
ncbi:cytochrome P450 [Mycena galericulata]|nr:cytochrome P450 [Mycena galericulata]